MGCKDFAPYVTQIIASKPDAIFTSDWGNDVVLLMRQSWQQGIKEKFYCMYIDDDMYEHSFKDSKMSIGHKATDNYFSAIPLKKHKEFYKRWMKEKKYPPSLARVKGYVAVMFFAEAIKKAGTTDVDAVIKAWEGLSHDSITGKLTMRACDHQAEMPFWTYETGKMDTYMITSENIPCEETGCKMKK